MTPQYIKYTILILLYVALWKIPLVLIGLKSNIDPDISITIIDLNLRQLPIGHWDMYGFQQELAFDISLFLGQCA